MFHPPPLHLLHHHHPKLFKAATSASNYFAFMLITTIVFMHFSTLHFEFVDRRIWNMKCWFSLLCSTTNSSFLLSCSSYYMIFDNIFVFQSTLSSLIGKQRWFSNTTIFNMIARISIFWVWQMSQLLTELLVCEFMQISNDVYLTICLC